MKSELTIDKDGTKEWILPNGQRHREGGPAVEYMHGTKLWYVNGLLHREDGPAVERSNDGDNAWYINGKRHREDGPAMECANGTKLWYLNDIRYNEVDYKYEMRSIKLNKLLK